MGRGSTVVDLKPPTRGAVSAEAPHLLPEDAVDALVTKNVVVRDGKLVNRPGFAQIGSSTVTGRPMGALFYKEQTTKRSVIGTTLGWYHLVSGVWTDITGGVALTGTADDHVRFVLWPTGTTYTLIGVNGIRDVPKKWTGSGNYADLGGAPPQAKDITIAANRVVIGYTYESATEQIFRVRWGGFNDHETWAAANFVDLSDTPDPLVGVRALNRTSFAIYKEASQWAGFATSGSAPYRFELQDQKPGPVSPASVIAVEGRHYYIGQDGSIYQFDGTRGVHIGEPIRRYIVNNLNFDKKVRAFSTYLKRDRDIWFFFPSTQQDDCDRAVSLNLDTMRFFPHELGIKVSAGTEWDIVSAVTWNGLSAYTWNNIADTYATWDSFGATSTPVDMVGQISGKIHTFGTAATDDGTSVSARWRFGPRSMGGAGKRVRVQSMDTFFDKSSATQNALLRIGTTDTLAQSPTFPAEMEDTFDTSSDEVFQARYDDTVAGYGTGKAEARFTAVEHQITTTTDWAWNGGVVRGYLEETGND